MKIFTCKIKVLVAPDEELPVDIEVGQLAGRQAGDVSEVIHLEPSPPAPAANVHWVDIDPLIHRGGREDPPGPGPQIPGQQEVTLDIGDGQVVTALAHGALLTHEQQQGHLVDSVRGEVELCLEGHAHVVRGPVGQEGGVARHPGGEAGLVQADALLADGLNHKLGLQQSTTSTVPTNFSAANGSLSFSLSSETFL